MSFHLSEGVKASEIVLDIPSSSGRTIVFCDLVGVTEGRPGFLMRMLGPPSGSGVARIVKMRQIVDKERTRRFLRRIAELPSIKMVTGCHSGQVRDDCATWLRRAADTL